MERLFRKSLANKIIAMVAAVTTLLTTLFTVYFTIHGRHSLENYSRVSGLSFVQSLAQSSVLGIMASEPLFLEQTFEIAQSNPEVIFIAAYDVNGSIIRMFSKIPVDLSLSKTAITALRENQSANVGAPMRIGDTTIDDFFAPVKSSGSTNELSDEVLAEPGESTPTTRSTIGFIRVGFSTERIRDEQRLSTIIGLVIGFSVLAFGILMTFIFGRKITVPLKELEAGAKRISDGDLKVNLEIKTDDEVGSVARAFNAMATTLRATTVSKDYVDNIVDSMNEAMVVIDPSRRIESLNAATQNLLGFSEDELKGSSIDALFAEADRHPFAATKWERFLARPISNQEAEFRSKDGHQIPVSISSAPIIDSHGKPRSLVIIARDMREINSLLEQLRSHASELERYQSVLLSMLDDNEQARNETESERAKTLAAVNSMSEGLIMFSLQAKEIVLINPAAKSMLDIDIEREVQPDHIITVLGNALEPFISGRSDLRGNRLVHDITIGNSPPRAIRIEGISIGEGVNAIGTMLVMRDITKERKLDEAKYELISNVSHELRTPLAIISNVISNLLVGIAGPLPEKVQTSLETCSNNTTRLAHIIDGLLSTASLDAGLVIIRRSNTDIGTLITELASAFQKDADEKGLTLGVELPQDELVSYVDPKIIHDVLENLISNALRFTPEGGRVTVSATKKTQYVEFAVSDTGIGIPPEEQISIFEHFHQVGRTYGPGEKGVGLGLSISRLLVQRHNGSIGVASNPGKGSRFYFTIPNPAGEELLTFFLKETLPASEGGAPKPFIASFMVASDGDGPHAQREAIIAQMKNRLETIFEGVNHIITRSLRTGEVLIGFVPNELHTAETIQANIDGAFDEFNRNASNERIVAVSIACDSNTTTPSQYIAELRNALQRAAS